MDSVDVVFPCKQLVPETARGILTGISMLRIGFGYDGFEVKLNLQLCDVDTDPSRLCIRGSVCRNAEATHADQDAVPGAIGDTSEARKSDSLYADTGEES